MGGLKMAQRIAAPLAALLAMASTAPAWSQGHGGGGGVSSNAPGATTMVNVHLCNKTSLKIYAAVTYRQSVGSDNWIVEGWKNIEPYTCFDVRAPNDSVFYDYAEDDAGGIWGGDFKLCVEHPGPFSRVNSSSYTCEPAELKGFDTVNVTGLADKTVNYNP
jgi:uncharacterized membrane protein